MNSRRKFLKYAFGGSLTLGSIQKLDASEKGVTMLDADGNLVEVDPEALKHSKKEAASNKDIYKWSNKIQK